MWKRKTTYFIILLVTILLGISLFTYIVHIPYITNQNELSAIQETLSEKYHINDIVEFSQYNSSETYYIVKSRSKLYIFNDRLGHVYDQYFTRLKFDDVKDLFNEEDYTKIKCEFGYENDKPCYLYTLETSSAIEYRYYNLETGQLIKRYSLKKGK